jgi:hypothetical protein
VNSNIAVACLAFAPNRGENWRMRNDDVPGFIRKLLPPVRRRAIAARGATFACALLAASPAATLAQGTQGAATFPVGVKELDYVDPHEGGRYLTLRTFYPAAIRERSAAPFVLPFFTKLNLYKDAEAADGEKRPLVVFSHGRGSNGLYYAWFAEFLASHGYIVAALNHYRANTYDSTIAYLANKLWQRPRDVALSISFLLNDPVWGKSIDADRIAVAGHSQGGFTALWVGGARVNPEKYLAFQRGWRNNPMVPEYLRNELPLDARRSTCTIRASRPCWRWRPASCRPSAWMRPGCGNSPCRPTSPSAPATPRRRRRTTPSSPRDTSPAPSFTSFPAASITTSSSMNVTMTAEMNFRRPASTLPASTAARSTRRSATPP